MKYLAYLWNLHPKFEVAFEAFISSVLFKAEQPNLKGLMCCSPEPGL